MHHLTRRLAPSLILATGALAATLPASAPAQTQQVATAFSIPSTGMEYTSTDAATTIRVSLTGTTFTIDDAVPIVAKDGCAPVSGDATKVTCTAFKDSAGRFKRFTVNARGGADSVQNNTTKTSGVGAPMLASGGAGNDTLVGADKVADELRGDLDQDILAGGNDTVAPGRDRLFGGTGLDHLFGGDSPDDLDGGLGNDVLDGGDGGDSLTGGPGDDHIDGGAVDTVGFHGDDLVSYRYSTDPVFVDLKLTDGQGPGGENDTIVNVEDVEGGQSDDFLFGDDRPNILRGLAGDDQLRGNGGADQLYGGDGADRLIPSLFTGSGVLPDGKADIMDGGEFGHTDPDPGDVAFRVLADGDFTHDVPTVIDN